MRISDWSSDVCSSDLPAWPKRLTSKYPLRPLTQRRQKSSSSELSIVRINRSRRTIIGPCPVCKTMPFPLSIVSIARSEEHTSELQSLMRISYAVFCLKKKKTKETNTVRQFEYQAGLVHTPQNNHTVKHTYTITK